MSSLDNTVAVISLNEVKEAIQESSNTYDAELNGFINRASAIIENYCQRKFIQQTYTNEEYGGNGQYRLKLRNWPVTALSTLQWNTSSDFANPDWETLDTSDYDLERVNQNDAGLIFLASGFVKGINNYRVTYTAGYAIDSMPHDIRAAAIELVAYMFRKRKATPGMRSETLGKYSYTAEPVTGHGIIKLLGLDELLAPYRSIPI